MKKRYISNDISACLVITVLGKITHARNMYIISIIDVK
jgi:hypothetical protein